MIKKVENNKDWCFYTCRDGDSLESVAKIFDISIDEIKESNPLFSSVYPGCVLYIQNWGKTRVKVGPMESLDTIARRFNITKEKLKQLNNLKTDNVFVGMQLIIEKGEHDEKNVV